MKIYTKTGDQGTTGLWGGLRVSKDALRIHAYGSVDECNAALGLARSSLSNSTLDTLLAELQNQLFVVGSDLAAPQESKNIPRVQAEHVNYLEEQIDALESQLPPLTAFILPGGHAAAAQLHLARTICRRAERWVVSLQAEEEINTVVLHYLNRLSDLLFVAARAVNAHNQLADIPWQKPLQTGTNQP